MKCFLLSFIVFLNVCIVNCQDNIYINHSCGFNHKIDSKTISLNHSNDDVKKALSVILNHTGLPSNFILKEASINNACAVIYCPSEGQCERYIIYDKSFLHNWILNGKTNFLAYAILAHEVGHHLSGHTLIEATDRHTEELEADKFAGFILHKLGANVSDLKSVYSILDESSSLSHPSKNNRISALINGWLLSKNENNSLVDQHEVGNVTDTDGNKYKTITIGIQTWMAENMRRKTDFGYYIPNNDSKNIGDFGYLYSWEAASQVCPSGWHLPSLDEYELLISYLGGDKNVVEKIKSPEFWASENQAIKGVNSAKFNALPAGNYYDGTMYDDSSHVESFGISTAWWTTNLFSYGRVGIIGILNNEIIIAEGKPRKDNGYSVRCVKD